MTHQMHPEAKLILARLAREQVIALYHFTSVENLSGIFQTQALCSKQTLFNLKRWPPLVPGGNLLSHNLDRHIGNWDKISLNLTPHTPMVYHKKQQQHLCFLIIRPEVAAWQGVVFTDSNAANTTNQMRGGGIAGLNNITFEAIRAIPRPWDRAGWVRPVQAEVLIPDQIPLEYISKVVFVSKASLMYTERLCKGLVHPPFSVNSQVFADFEFRISKWKVDFSHVTDLIITDSKIDENVIHLPHAQKNKFSKKESDRVTAIASVQANTGTKAEVRWLPINLVETTTFDTSDHYFHWPHLETKKLPNGVYSVEYLLNGLHWAATDFEITQ